MAALGNATMPSHALTTTPQACLRGLASLETTHRTHGAMDAIDAIDAIDASFDTFAILLKPLAGTTSSAITSHVKSHCRSIDYRCSGA